MKTLLLTAAAIAFAAPAFAQDADPATAPPATTSGYAGGGSTFTGPRAEIIGGWDRAGYRFRETDATGTNTVRDHRNGVTGGAQVGYDMPVGDRLVAGAFGSYMLSSAKSCYDTGGCLKSGRQIEGGARIGAKLMSDKALAYVKGAYVNGRFRDTADDVYGNRNGWRAGAGLEYALNPHLYTKVEYDYTRYSSFHFDTPTADQSLRFDRNQVLAGVGVRF